VKLEKELWKLKRKVNERMGSQDNFLGKKILKEDMGLRSKPDIDWGWEKKVLIFDIF